MQVYTLTGHAQPEKWPSQCRAVITMYGERTDSGKQVRQARPEACADVQRRTLQRPSGT